MHQAPGGVSPTPLLLLLPGVARNHFFRFFRDFLVRPLSCPANLARVGTIYMRGGGVGECLCVCVLLFFVPFCRPWPSDLFLFFFQFFFLAFRLLRKNLLFLASSQRLLRMA